MGLRRPGVSVHQAPNPIYPAYTVGLDDYPDEPVCTVTVNRQTDRMDQIEELLRQLLVALKETKPVAPPPRVPDSSSMDKLLGMLSSQMKHSEPMVPPVPAPTGLEDMLRSYFAGVQSPKNAIPGRSGAGAVAQW